MDHVAIVGATGAVGSEIRRLLQERNFPAKRISCFASARSAHKAALLTEQALNDVDLAFFCAGASVSKQYIPHALNAGALVIDSSSAFRTDPSVPLIIPEINGHLHEGQRILSSPNCVASILLMALFPLHRLFRTKRVILTTYQAASGGGASLMQRLKDETTAYLKGELLGSSPYAFNLFLHNSPLHKDFYLEEERKIHFEVRKILQDETLKISATCVRVPVLRAHALSANIEFHDSVDLEKAEADLHSMPGLIFSQDRFPTPHDATGKNEVFCGRLRIDPSQQNTLEFWAVGDQLLKGAALNAVQIAENCLSKK